MANTKNMYKGEYKWTINGDKLRDMINAKNGEIFLSNKFKMASLNWIIEACPNGWKSDQIGAFMVWSKLLSVPANKNKVMISRRIFCDELGSSSTFIKLYKKNSSFGWGNYCLSLNDIKTSNLKEISLSVQVIILRIISNDSIDNHSFIYQHDIVHEKPFKNQSFEWNINNELIHKIKNAYNRKQFASQIFNKMWCLEVAPNGAAKSRNDYFDIILVLCAIPKDISKLMVNFKVNCKEMNVKTDRTEEFDMNGCHRFYWSTEKKLSFNKFKGENLDSLSISVEIEILDIYDNDNNKIAKQDWNQYINELNKNLDEKEEKQQIEISRNKLETDSNINTDQMIIRSLSTRIDEINKKIESLINNIHQNQENNDKKINDLQQQISVINKQQQINNKKLEDLQKQRMQQNNTSINTLTNKMEQIEQRLNNLEENECKKENDESNIMMIEFDKMQNQINKLIELQSHHKNDDNKEETEREKVRLWMNNKVNLRQYTQIMIDNGFDDMDSIKHIKLQDLEAIGIHKIGHQRKIYQYAQILNEQNESQLIQQIYNDPISPKQAISSPSAAYSQNINIWICSICNTKNRNSVSLCSLCGVKRNFGDTDIEGPNVVDTAK